MTSAFESTEYFNSNESSPVEDYSDDSSKYESNDEVVNYEGSDGEMLNSVRGVGHDGDLGNDNQDEEEDNDIGRYEYEEEANDTGKEDEESKSFHSIFLLNPLTLYFLSGFACQLVVLSFEHDHYGSDNRNKMTTDQTNNIRMNRWWCFFKKHCVDLFKNHHAAYEGNAIQTTHSSSQLYSQLLIGATQEILRAVNCGDISQTMFSKVKVWHNLIDSMVGKPLWKSFEAEDELHLKKLVLDLKEVLSSGEQSQDFNLYEYPHFSPQALFIRCSFIVFIHNDSHHLNYKQWEYTSSLFLSEIFHISDFLQSDNHNSTDFPYIQHLPCSLMYQSLTGHDPLHHPVPLHEIFYQILDIIQGNMMSYENMKQNTLCDEQLTVFEFIQITNDVKVTMNQEKSKVSNSEKQRLHQQKKRKIGKGNNKSNPMQMTPWMTNFLFLSTYYKHFGQKPPHDQQIFAN